MIGIHTRATVCAQEHEIDFVDELNSPLIQGYRVRDEFGVWSCY